MKRKYYFVEIMLFAVWLCCTVNGYGQETQKYSLHFDGDTVRVAPDPAVSEGYYPLWDYTVSGFYTVIDSLSYGCTHVAVLSPVAMTPEAGEKEGVLADRLLLIEEKGKKWAYPDVINNELAWIGGSLYCEHLVLNDEGFSLEFEAGQGWKIYYRIDIVIREGVPQITEIYFEEHNGALTFRRETTCNYNGHNEFPLSRYDRSVPGKVRKGERPEW